MIILDMKSSGGEVDGASEVADTIYAAPPPGLFRPLLRLWYCRLRRVHDWTVYGVGRPYEFRVCSLCYLRRPERIVWEVETMRQEFQRAAQFARLGVAGAAAGSMIRAQLAGELIAYEAAQQRMDELLKLMRTQTTNKHP